MLNSGDSDKVHDKNADVLEPVEKEMVSDRSKLSEKELNELRELGF